MKEEMEDTPKKLKQTAFFNKKDSKLQMVNEQVI